MRLGRSWPTPRMEPLIRRTPNQRLRGRPTRSDAIHPMPAGCVQHQADTTRAPTFHSTPVRRLLQLAPKRGSEGRTDRPSGRDTVADHEPDLPEVPEQDAQLRAQRRHRRAVQTVPRGLPGPRRAEHLLMAAEARFLGLEPLGPRGGRDRDPRLRRAATTGVRRPQALRSGCTPRTASSAESPRSARRPSSRSSSTSPPRRPDGRCSRLSDCRSCGTVRELTGRHPWGSRRPRRSPISRTRDRATLPLRRPTGRRRRSSSTATSGCRTPSPRWCCSALGAVAAVRWRRSSPGTAELLFTSGALLAVLAAIVLGLADGASEGNGLAVHRPARLAMDDRPPHPGADHRRRSSSPRSAAPCR